MITFLIILVLVLVAIIFFLARKAPEKQARLRVKDLSSRARGQVVALAKTVLGAKKVKTSEPTNQDLIYVLQFNGDLSASQVASLREEISAILYARDKLKPVEVIVKIKSPGGTVNGYGLAAAQLARLRKAQIPLTVVVDEVAASGGYLMAATANKIVAAPMALLGSVGVVMEFPNFARLLNRLGVEYKQYTAGEHKRTLSPFRPATFEGEEKTREKLVNVHDLFKAHIKEYRPQVDLEKTATGDTWYGREALDLKLVDEVATFDEYLGQRLFTHRVWELSWVRPEKLSRKLSLGLVRAVNEIGEYWLARWQRDSQC